MPTDCEPLPEPTAAPTILLIAEDITLCRHVTATLREAGYEALVAYTAISGLAQARDRQPDLILLAAVLPDLEPLALLARLAADVRTAALPVLVLPGRADDAAQETFRRAGARAVVPDPVEPAALRDLVRAHARPPGVRTARPGTGPGWESAIGQGISRLVHADLDADRVCQAVVDGAVELLGLAAATLWLLEGEVLELRVQSSLFAHAQRRHTRIPVGHGLIGMVALERRPFVTADAGEDPRVKNRATFEALGLRAFLAVPLVREGSLLGVLSGARTTTQPFHSADVRMLDALAEHAAAVLHQARLLHESERRRRTAEALALLATEISAAESDEVNLDRVVGYAQQLLACDVTYLALHEPRAGAAAIAALRGSRSPEFASVTVPPGEGVSGRVIARGEPFRTGDYLGDPGLSHGLDGPIRAEGIVAVLAVPIWLGGRVIGVLWTGRREPRPFTDDDQRVLEQLAAQAAVALGNAWLYRDARAAEAKLRRQLDVQAAVAAFGQRALAATEVPPLLRDAAALVAGTLGVEYGNVWQLEPEGRAFALAAGAGAMSALVGEATVGAGRDSQAGYTLLSQAPVIVADWRVETRFAKPPSAVAMGMESGMTAIIAAHGRPFGVLGAASTRRRSFTQEDVHFLQAVANVLATAIERQRATEALERLRRQHELILNSAGEGIFGVDLEGNFTFVNPRAAWILGFEVGELIGRPQHALIHHTKADGTPFPREECPMYLAFKAGVVRRGDDLFWRKDGTSVPIAYTSTPIREGTRIVGKVVMFQDVTERKQLEEQFHQAQKMEAVGKLAGGIAHDFNNLLTAISGYTELVLAAHARDDPVRRDLDEIRKTTERAAQLTRQLLAFSRRQVLQPKVLDLNGVVGDVDRMLQRLIGEDVDLETVLAPGLGRVKADPGQIEQVLMNLVVNARDAMPDGGKLTVETADVELDEAYAERHVDVRPGPYVMLAVTDTGCGMDAQTQSRIFEPFFTTKAPGKGTGLGLSTVYGIVNQSGGHVWVYSEPGRGTTFKIYLPRADEADEPRVSAPGPRTPSHGGETILLVEDDEDVRGLARRVLAQAGYVVLEAPNGRDALAIGRRHEGAIALMLTDVIMPDLTGRTVADQLAAVRPETRVLYMSGYTDGAIVHQGALEPGIAFLAKPFSPDALLRRVREVLDGAGPERVPSG